MRERLAELALEIAQEAVLAAKTAVAAGNDGKYDVAAECTGRSKGLVFAARRIGDVLRETA